MVELNPQIRKKVKVIDISPDFLHTVCLIRKSISTEERDIIERSFLNLNKITTGKEFMTIFKWNTIKQGKEEHLFTTRQLYKDFQSIREK